MGFDLVAVPPPISLARHIAILDQLGKDLVGCAFLIPTVSAMSRRYRMPGSWAAHKRTWA